MQTMIGKDFRRDAERALVTFAMEQTYPCRADREPM